jgi:hypothetical protein
MHFNTSFSSGGPDGLAAIGMIIIGMGWLIVIVIHIAFAIAVIRDADRLLLEGRLLFVPPLLWALATLLGGMTSAAIYWAMHHSRLNPAMPIVASAEPPAEA